MSEVTQAQQTARAIVDGWLALGGAFRTPDILAGMIANAIDDEQATHTAPMLAAMERAAEALKVAAPELRIMGEWVTDPTIAKDYFDKQKACEAALTDLTDAIKAGKGEQNA
jgi:hypothetical protein